MKGKLLTKNFLLILQGDAISTIGNVLYSIAIGYWVYQKTGSTALMGVMSSISMITTMVVQPISGAIVDRLNRKKVIVAMDALRGYMMIVVAVLAFANTLSIPQILILSFLGALGNVFFQLAIDTVFINIITKDEMMRGQSISQAIANIINLVGKALSGALVAWLGVPTIILLNASMMIALPQESKATVLSFISSASIGASGLGTMVAGVLGEFISLQTLFIITAELVLLPILYMCLNKTTKELIYNN